ncbi:MAG TPA: hypothetical protein VF762_21570 [Blastocatellia bacterium]|jgi:hypothetical protein
MEHRATERGFYDQLQLPERREARELVERLLSNPTNTYEQICIVAKSSGLFEDLKDVTPQDLTRYRQRKAREESRASVMALIEAEGDTLLNAAATKPTGVIASYLRKMLTERAISRFDEEVENIDPVHLSRETARHALVEQRDRKLDLDEEKIGIEKKRLELQQQQQDLAKDKFGVAANTWSFILRWLAKVDASAADRLTQHSDELLNELEIYIENA